MIEEVNLYLNFLGNIPTMLLSFSVKPKAKAIQENCRIHVSVSTLLGCRFKKEDAYT